MEEATAQQYWIRNDDGKRWGPLLASTLELLVPQKVFKGRLQASVDGENFVQIGRFPALREVLEPEWWGVDPDTVDSLPPPPGLAPPEDTAAAASAASAPSSAPLDPSALAPEAAPAPAGAPLDPSALAPDPEPEPGPEPDALSLPLSGDLAEHSPINIVFLIAVKAVSARLAIEGPAGQAVVHFRKGKPEHVDGGSTPLAEWLVEKGHLDAAKKAQAEEAAAGFGGSFTAALFGQGLMDPGSGFQHLATWAGEAYDVILQLDAGRFEISLDAPMPPDAFPLGNNPLQALVKVLRKLPEEEVKVRLGARLEAPAMKTNLSGTKIDDLGLGPQETRLYPLFDGVHSAAELAAAQGEKGATLLRLAYLLAECGFLSFAGVEAPEAKQPEAKKETEAAPEEAIDWEARRTRALAMLKRVEQGEHFLVLGLKRSCTDDDVKDAYQQRIRAFHPDRAAGGPDDLAEIYRSIFEAVTEARRSIDTDAKRRAYLNAQAEAELAREATQKSADLFAPIEALLDAHNFEKALQTAESMLAEDPENAGARAYLAWITVRAADDRAAVQPAALEQIARALQADPRSAEAHLCAARIAKAFGDTENARHHLKQAKALGARLKTKKKKKT